MRRTLAVLSFFAAARAYWLDKKERKERSRRFSDGTLPWNERLKRGETIEDPTRPRKRR
jgi:hypothetical protein